MSAAIEARGLSKRYAKGREAALSEVSLSIPPGAVYGLIGRNGAGKTTFIRICATQLLPSAGDLRVLGFDVRGEERKIRERIACVPQESRPLYFLNVWELVYLYLKMRGLDAVESRRRTTNVLDELGLSEVKGTLVNRLSGGMRRRAMVAMVLASDAEILFLDEPTTGLDPIARREVWGAIRRASREKRTVLLTTHYLDEAEALSARLALLEKGRLLLEGPPSELRGRVRLPYRVTVQGSFLPSELERFGQVSDVEGGHLVFAQEGAARELAMLALSRGAKVSMGPVSLEDIFMEVVGRSIEDDAPAAEAT
ncbi:MAG: ABC transporter ATP-binding protein [Thermoplasmata archaeon]|nr:ABC transporter ATP-binding protein [Thermoplasmata archaeon]